MARLIIFIVIGVWGILGNQMVLADDNEEIRERLTQRYASGVSQKQLAGELGVHSSTVSRYLSGKIQRSPTIVRNYKRRFQGGLGQQLPRMDPLLPPDGAEGGGAAQKEVPFLPSQLKKLSFQRVPPPAPRQAPILIAYREDGDGKGAYYDHYSLQKATHFATTAIKAPEHRREKLDKYIHSGVYNLEHGTEENGRKIVDFTQTPSACGLLVIPGRMRDKENDSVRTKLEQELIQKARKTGQPILALCAGSWQLWDACGGREKRVEDHCYGGGMIRVSQSNGTIVYNVQIHRIRLKPGSMLAGAMGVSAAEQLLVNSLHWKAPDEDSCPGELEVTAWSVADEGIAPNRRVDGIQMHAEEDTVEAFESKNGAPFKGIQWHPEAYNAGDEASRYPQAHRNLLSFMAQAGTAYAMRQRMVSEFKSLMADLP